MALARSRGVGALQYVLMHQCWSMKASVHLQSASQPMYIFWELLWLFDSCICLLHELHALRERLGAAVVTLRRGLSENLKNLVSHYGIN